jgi:hypothetical protein
VPFPWQLSISSVLAEAARRMQFYLVQDGIQLMNMKLSLSPFQHLSNMDTNFRTKIELGP